jgi:transcriptional regulator with PAS, ATPase and Fis domain
LRAIQFGQIERLGSNNTINLDVRIVAATHRNLEEMISKNQFREDLFYRLNVVSIHIPPLRNHKTDIPVLVDHFITKYSELNEKDIKGISKEALDKLLKYDFPGNIRELENLIEHAVVMSRTEYINISDLPKQVEFMNEQTLLDPLNISDGHETKMHAFESAMIKEALKLSNGNQSAAARKLGITERHLRSRLDKLNLKNK